jgi:hypothetical protein
MNAADVTRQLQEIADTGDDFEWRSGQLTEKWEDDPESFEAVEPILRFMESHPEIEYGVPGALVHFIERFPNCEGKVVESVERQPTPHTVWMLNRMINGKHDPEEREALIRALQRVLENPAADAMTRDRASDFLEFQARRAAEYWGRSPSRP